MRSLLLISLAIGLGKFAQADDLTTIPREAVAGIGAYDCEHVISWIERGDDSSIVISWVWGFWSAYNIWELEKGRPAKSLSERLSDPMELEAVLLGRCYEDRSAKFIQVALDVWRLLPDVILNEGLAE